MVAEPEPISVQEAAHLANVSERAVRNWLRDKNLPFIQTEQGKRIQRGDLMNFLQERQKQFTGLASELPEPTPIRPVVTPEPPSEPAILKALEMVDRLQKENLELAGRVGFYQAKNQELENRVLLLEAPKPPQGSVVTLPREEIPVETQSASVGQFDPVEHMPETKPWWKRLLALE